MYFLLWNHIYDAFPMVLLSILTVSLAQGIRAVPIKILLSQQKKAKIRQWNYQKALKDFS